MTFESDLARNERLIGNALRAIQVRIDDLYALPQTDLNDVRIAAALQLRADVAAVFALEFDGVISETVSSYAKAARLAAQELARIGIAGAFTATDTALLDALMRNTKFELEAVSMAAQSKITEAIYISAIAGTKRAEVMGQIRQILRGGTDRAGAPMETHANTILRTGYMETYTAVMLQKSKRAGLKFFKYSGATVTDSRAWCLSHLGKIYSIDEIEAWRDKKWQGKKAGDPFVVRGGWNCIHRWIPVLNAPMAAASEASQ
jgi:hypothetical protein